MGPQQRRRPEFAAMGRAFLLLFPMMCVASVVCASLHTSKVDIAVVGPDSVTGLDTLENTVVWKFLPRGRILRHARLFQFAGPTVFAVSGGSVEALNFADGSLNWRYVLEKETQILTSLLSPDGTKLFVTTEQRQSLFALSIDDGSRLWSNEMNGLEMDDALPTLGLDETKIYTIAKDLIDYDSDTYSISVYCLSALDGSTLWHFDLPQISEPSPVSLTWNANQTVLYFADANPSFLYALSPEDGSVLWQSPLDSPVQLPPNTEGTSILVGCVSFIYYLNPIDGSVLWRFKIEGQVNSMIVGDGGMVYVSTSLSTVHALDTAHGTGVWQYTETSPKSEWHDAVTVLQCSNNCSQIYACHRWHANGFNSVDATTGSLLWTQPSVNCGATWRQHSGNIYFQSGSGAYISISAEDGSLLWVYDAGWTVRSSLIVNNDTSVVSFSGSDKTLYALHHQTGEILWKFRVVSDVESDPLFSQDLSTVYVSTSESVYAVNAVEGAARLVYQTEGAIRSRPLLNTAESMLFVGSLDGNLYAFKTSDMSLVWSYPTDGPVWSSPALGENGVVYFGSEDGNLVALESKTGSLLWRFRTASAIVSSPVVSEDMHVVVFGSTDRYIYAVDLVAGFLSWRYKTEDAVRSSPCLSLHSRTVYAGSNDNHIYAINGTDGSLMWKYETGGTVASSPILEENSGILFVGSSDNYLYAVNATDGEMLWKYETYGDIEASPCSSNDNSVVFVGSSDANLYALHTTNGTLRWKSKTGGSLSSCATSNSVGSVLYIGSSDHHLYAFDTETGLIRWKTPTTSEIRSSPTLNSNGSILYIGSDDALFYSVYLETGTFLWKYDFDDSVTDLEAHDEFLVITGRTSVHVVQSGNLAWEYNLEKSTLGGISLGSLVSFDIALFTFTTGVVALNTTEMSTLWEFTETEDVRDVAIHDLQLYVSDASGVSALDITTGKQLWTSSENVENLIVVGSELFAYWLRDKYYSSHFYWFSLEGEGAGSVTKEVEDSWWSPDIAVTQNAAYVINYRGLRSGWKVYSFRMSTGEESWSKTLSSELQHFVASFFDSDLFLVYSSFVDQVETEGSLGWEFDFNIDVVGTSLRYMTLYIYGGSILALDKRNGTPRFKFTGGFHRNNYPSMIVGSEFEYEFVVDQHGATLDIGNSTDEDHAGDDGEETNADSTPDVEENNGNHGAAADDGVESNADSTPDVEENNGNHGAAADDGVESNADSTPDVEENNGNQGAGEEKDNAEVVDKASGDHAGDESLSIEICDTGCDDPNHDMGLTSVNEEPSEDAAVSIAVTATASVGIPAFCAVVGIVVWRRHRKDRSSDEGHGHQTPIPCQNQPTPFARGMREEVGRSCDQVSIALAACRQGDIATLTRLMSSGIEPKPSWLIECVRYNQRDALRAILSNGFNPSSKTAGACPTTALHKAAYTGALDCATELLQWGADAHAQDWEGRTPFDIALDSNHEDLSAVLKQTDRQTDTVKGQKSGNHPIPMEKPKKMDKEEFEETKRKERRAEMQRNRREKARREMEEREMEERRRTEAVHSDWEIPPSFFCPITQQIMRHPVTTIDGHAYEREAIEMWLKDKDTSPKTNAILENKVLVPAYALQNAIEEWENSQMRLISKQNLTIHDPHIASGAFKTVYKGSLWQGSHSIDVAVLKLRKGSCAQEAKIAIRLGSHPRLVRFFGQIRDAENDLIVTEFAPRGSLSDILDEFEGRLTSDHILTILQQICHGMEALASAQVVHCDLAARNVLIFEFDIEDSSVTNVKICDFGLSIRQYGRTHASVQSGEKVPLRYMPPEALRKGRYSEKSDVWAFGVTAWEILTYCDIPFYNLQDDQVCDHVCNGGILQRPDNSACSDDLWSILQRCWRQDPKERPTFRILGNELALL